MIKDWIERYVYAVGERLPKGQREDIEKEIHSLILDALDEKVAGKKEKHGQGDTATEEDVLAVLDNFGNPQEMASNYLPHRRYLIGPELFHTYLMVMKIVLAVVAFGLGVATFVSIVVNGTEVVENLIKLPLQFISGAISVVGTITIVFALIQYYDSDRTLPGARKKDDWNSRDLTPVPLPTNRLKRSSMIAEICFMVVVMVAINFFLDYFAVFSLGQGKTTSIPLFNLQVVSSYIPYFNLLLFFGIIWSAYKLKLGEWTNGARVGSIILSLGGVLIFVIFATNPAIFNPALGESLLGVINLGLRVVMAIVILTTAYDIFNHLIKMMKNTVK